MGEWRQFELGGERGDEYADFAVDAAVARRGCDCRAADLSMLRRKRRPRRIYQTRDSAERDVSNGVKARARSGDGKWKLKCKANDVTVPTVLRSMNALRSRQRTFLFSPSDPTIIRIVNSLFLRLCVLCYPLFFCVCVISNWPRRQSFVFSSIAHTADC